MHPKKKIFARVLRGEQTPAEEKVWELLRNRKFNGMKFRRQHVVEGFVVDFYCPEEKLAVEIDGKIHDKKMHKEYDQFRQEELESKSVKVVRITNREIEQDENILFNRIKEAITP